MTVTRMQPGDRISEYILEELLGRGGFGEVWRARHHEWGDRFVAIKIPTHADAIRQLYNEGMLQSELRHPGIVPTLGIDISADPPYFITEFVPGQNLRQRLEQFGPLAAVEVQKILTAVLDVLGYAHERGVVHQDIKPANMILTPDGELKLTDFGLGQNVQGESLLLSASLRSEEAGFAGTLAYVAPEVRDGQGRVDGRADLYSLGIVLFELLTGHRPVGGEVPSDLRPELPHWCDPIFRGLYARLDRRFGNVAAVQKELERLLANPGPSAISVEPLSPPKQLVSFDKAARLLRMSALEIRHWMRRGVLTAIHVDEKIHFRREELDAFGREHPTASSTAAPAGRTATATATATSTATAASADGAGIGIPVPANPVVTVKGRMCAPAGLFIRGIAMSIDFALMLFVFTLPPTQLLACFVPPLLFMGPGARTVILIGCYFAVTTGLFGRTLGKWALGLRVVHGDGSRLGLFDGCIRTINYAFSALPLGLGFLAVLFSRRKLALHDFLCDTRVVHDHPCHSTRPVPSSRSAQ